MKKFFDYFLIFLKRCIFYYSLNHGLVLKNVCKIKKFTLKAWLESYIKMNTQLRKKKTKMISKNIFSG